MYHLTCTSICCSQPFQPNKSSSGWQPYLKCRRAFDIIYISMRASLFCHATIQSSVHNLAHASLETAVVLIPTDQTYLQVRKDERDIIMNKTGCIIGTMDMTLCNLDPKEGYVKMLIIADWIKSSQINN